MRKGKRGNRANDRWMTLQEKRKCHSFLENCDFYAGWGLAVLENAVKELWGDMDAGTTTVHLSKSCKFNLLSKKVQSRNF